MHQGRQWTQTLRNPRVPELEYLRLDDKTIDGTILSSLSRKVRRGPLRESFGAKLHAACMTAMISGPRYGSTSELQRAADATRSRARRQYTPPFALFRGLEKKMCTHPKGGPARFRITNFRPGIFGEARCYTERSMTTRLGGCARTMASFITFVASCSETPFSS